VGALTPSPSGEGYNNVHIRIGKARIGLRVTKYDVKGDYREKILK
jgi:hypothetical protein